MGFGASTVVVDESAIIPDEMYGKIFRMVGGTGGKIVQLGNPFPLSTFPIHSDDPTYTTLTVDWRQAVAEGRFTKEYIEEARRTITHFDFTVFYDCIFPVMREMCFGTLCRLCVQCHRSHLITIYTLWEWTLPV